MGWRRHRSARPGAPNGPTSIGAGYGLGQLAGPLDTLGGDAEGAGEGDEVRVAIGRAVDAASIEAALEIMDDAVALVIHDQPDDGELVVGGGCELHRAHEERAIAADTRDRTFGAGDLGADGTGDGPAHRLVVMGADDGGGPGREVAAQPARPLGRVREHERILRQRVAQLAHDPRRL